MRTIADRRSNATWLPARRLAAPLGTLLLAMAVAGAAQAQSEAYRVRGVAVDATAKTAAEARDRAIDQGHVAAFRRLVRRLVSRGSRGAVPSLSARQVARLVTDFGIEGEKRSTVRYLATLNFRFDRASVRTILRGAGVPFAETVRRPMLVLPVFRWAGAALLWDRPNPWRAAWAAPPADDGLVPFIVPEASLQDIADISASQALAADSARVADIAARYGTDGALVAAATLSTDPARNVSALAVELRVFENDAWRPPTTLTVSEQEGETTAAFFARAVSQTADVATEDWRSRNLLRFDSPAILDARAPLTGLSELVRLRRAIEDVAVVDSTELLGLSRRAAWLRLRYVGEVGQLREALALRDIALTGGEGAWQLGFDAQAGQAGGQ